MTDEFTTYDAAYLLGALTPADRAEYEQHLAECSRCRGCVHELAGLPGLLATVPPERAQSAGEPGPDVPATLLPRLMAQVQRARSRRRWTSALVGAAAAAVLAVTMAVGLHPLLSDSSTQTAPKPGTARQMRPVSPDIPVTATASLADTSTGTLITIRCKYSGDESPDQGPFTYTMVVVDKHGSTWQLAEWAAVPGRLAVVDGSAPVPQSRIALVKVLGPHSRPLLTLRP